MAPSVLCFSLCLIVLFHCSLGRLQQQRQLGQCQLDKLDAMEPRSVVQSEAGKTEVWDWTNEQFQCAGVSVVRVTIEPQGLLLPFLFNAPKLSYVVQGKGFTSTLLPGCPETFQSFEPSQQGQRFQEQHQRVRNFRQGDILATPAGVAHWCYNDGNEPLVVVSLIDQSNYANQLENKPRGFFLAGNLEEQHQQQERQEEGGGRPGRQQKGRNVFAGMDVKLLAEVFGVNEEIARRLQNPNDKRGSIIKIEGGLQLIKPSRMQEEQAEPRREQQQGGGGGSANGAEESAMCNMRLRENIGDPSRADVYSPRAGRISNLNSNHLPILEELQLNAQRGILYSNAIMGPYYNLNSHSVCYVTRGRARVQIVDDNGRAVFDGEVREGQVLIAPQNFAVLKQAGNEGFEWVSFKTNDNAVIAQLAGQNSAITAMPTHVLVNAYKISPEDAQLLKYSRPESTLFASSGSRPQSWSVA